MMGWNVCFIEWDVVYGVCVCMELDVSHGMGCDGVWLAAFTLGRYGSA